MKELTATVKENKQIAADIYSLTLTLPERADVVGGQFLNVSTGNASHLLKRPFGIMKAEGNDVTFCYQVKGEGTLSLASARVGDKLNVLLPLGNWFDLEEYGSVAVIGGGVGIFPLIAAIRQNYKEKQFYSYIGFRNEDAVCLLDELEKSKKLTVVTDDGSYGGKGNAVEAFLNDPEGRKADCIIACGPPVMLRVLKQKLAEHAIKTPCFVSLEERMGCGMGACLVCVCRLEDGENARVCRDGPIFDINDVKL